MESTSQLILIRKMAIYAHHFNFIFYHRYTEKANNIIYQKELDFYGFSGKKKGKCCKKHFPFPFG
jgi:predicted Zn-dependent protease